MTGPLIDTLIICTLTASTILVTGVWNQKFEQKFDYRNLEVASSIVVDPLSFTVVMRSLLMVFFRLKFLNIIMLALMNIVSK